MMICHTWYMYMYMYLMVYAFTFFSQKIKMNKRSSLAGSRKASERSQWFKPFALHVISMENPINQYCFTSAKHQSPASILLGRSKTFGNDLRLNWNKQLYTYASFYILRSNHFGIQCSC